MEKDIKRKLDDANAKLSGYKVDVYKQQKYVPTLNDANFVILKTVLYNIYLLKNVEEKLEQNIKSFADLLEVKVHQIEGDNSLGMSSYFTAVSDLSNEELINIFKLNIEVQSAIKVQEDKQEFNK